jgi:hypothetical protein
MYYGVLAWIGGFVGGRGGKKGSHAVLSSGTPAIQMLIGEGYNSDRQLIRLYRKLIYGAPINSRSILEQ